MKRTSTLIALLFTLFSCGLFAQLNIKVQIEKIRVLNNVNCDATGASDFLFEYKATDNSSFAYSNNAPVAGSIGQCNYAVVNENNGPFTIIPSAPGTASFSPTNGVFFNRNYSCKKDIPSVITIVWRGYENDDVTTPSIPPIASGTTAISSQTVGIVMQDPYVQSFQYTLTSVDGGCAQTYEATFSVLVSYGSYIPLFIDHIHETTICTGASNGQLEGHPLGGSGTVLNDWSYDGLGDYNDPLLITGLTVGTYTFVAKDALNCTDTLIAHVTSVNPPASIAAFTASTATVCSGQSAVLYSVPTLTTVTYVWNYSGTGVSLINSPNANLSASFQGTATSGVLSVYAQNSCSVSPSLTMAVTVVQTPTVTTSGNISACDNAPTVLTAGGASAYVWSTGATTPTISVNPSANTVYTVTGNNGGLCFNTKQISVSVIASPTVSISGSTAAVCPNHTVSVSASGNGSLYVWSDGFIGTSNTISASATTIYTVSSILNSCITQATYTLNVNPLPAINISGNTVVCPGKTVTLTASGATSYAWSNGSLTSSITYTPSGPATFTVVGTSALTGCVGSKTVSVNSFPAGLVAITGNTAICNTLQGVLTASGSDFYLWNNGATASTNTISPTSSTTVSVVGTTINGCKDSTSVAINVINNLSISILGPDSVCTGQSVTLIANVGGASSYSWNTGALTQSITVTPASTYTYIVTATNQGCSGSKTHVVAVKALPVVSFNVHSPMCMDAGLYTLSATPPGGLYLGSGISNNTFDPNVGVGSYAIIYQATGSNGCMASATQTIEVVSCVGIEDYQQDHTLTLYPNPSNGIVFITSGSSLKSIAVLDYTGKLVKQVELNAMQEASVDLTGLASGIYTFTISAVGGYTKTIKVIKQ